jgi:hypothetical protein
MKIAIGTYEHTRALKDGSVASARLPLECVEVSPITRAFREAALTGQTLGVRAYTQTTGVWVRGVWSDRTGVRPVNHVVAIKTELWPLRDDIIDVFERARAGDGGRVPPIGIEPSRAAFETLTRYASEQGITPRELSVDELFEP